MLHVKGVTEIDLTIDVWFAIRRFAGDATGLVVGVVYICAIGRFIRATQLTIVVTRMAQRGLPGWTIPF